MKAAYTSLFLFFSILLFSSAQAQVKPVANGKISGKVVDAVTRQPVDYATISVFKQGSTTPFNGMSTDPKGNFTIEHVPAGEYIINADFIGYKRTILEHVMVKDAGTVFLGQVKIAPVSNELKGVTVTASAPTVENKIDKLIYNPANDLSAQGGVAIDVLKKVPMITVDIDGNVELQGNANIRFLINGKPSSIFGSSLTDALASIPASQIKSIEVITSPGAKYDAAGTGGIVNIILKSSKVEGVNGSVNLSAGTRRENGSFNLNARKGNVSVNTFFSGNAQINTNAPSTRSRTSTSGDTVNTLFQQGSNNFKRNGYQSGLSLSWDITPKDALSASVGFNHFGNHGMGLTNQDQNETVGLNDVISDIKSARNSSSKYNGTSTDVSLNYKKSFAKEGQELELLYTSSFGNNSFSSFQQTDYAQVLGIPSSGINNTNPGKDRETDISLDYTDPVTKKFTLETGGKLVFNHINNNVITDTLKDGTYQPNANQTYGFNYDSKIYAYYLSASTSVFNDFLDFKAGLRDEYTTTQADFQGVKIPSYNILAPSLVLSHKFSESESLKISYTRRIQRPDYGDLNPFLNISDPHNISTGNPNLKPEKGDNFELGYNKSYPKGANINIAVFYRRNTQDIQQYTTFHDVYDVNGTSYSDVSLTQTFNLGSEVREGVNLYASVPVTSKLSLRSNMIFSDRRSTNQDTSGTTTVSGFAYRININAQYSFDHDLSVEFFGNYNSSQKSIQGTNPKFVFYNFALRKMFLNKKASIGLTATNPFAKYVSQSSTTFGSNFYQTNVRLVPIQSFGISLSYKFGKLEFKKDNEKGDNMDAPDAPADKGK